MTPIEKRIFKHINENACKKSIYIDFISGHQDHVHCLLALKADVTIAKTIQLLKGESSFWINKNNLCKSKFEWADEYFAVSVSESQVPKVRDYLRNQEQHHMHKSWTEEYETLMSAYGFDKISG